MKIAVMSNQADLTGCVPDTFETSPALLIIETENMTLVQAFSGMNGMEYAKIIAKAGWEAVACGPHIGKDCFDPIADACVTRYNGAGMSVCEAALAADRGTLPLIPDFEGGTGCGSGAGECGECEHPHDN